MTSPTPPTATGALTGALTATEAAQLTAEQRRTLLADLTTQLDTAHAQLDQLREHVRTLDHDRQALLDADAATRLDNIDPTQFWTDPDLRGWLVDLDWNGGRGNRRASDFITAAINAIGGDDFYEYDRRVDPHTHTVTHLSPRLKLTYQQNTDQAHTALLTMLPALTRNDAMIVDVFEHTLSRSGSITLRIHDADHADVLRNNWPEHTGTLASALTHIARTHWYDGGPTRDTDNDW